MSPLEHELTAHARALRALARQLVGDAWADDLVQDTALQVLRSPPPPGAPLRGWLLGVLRRRASTHRRGERRRDERERARVPAEPAPEPASTVARREALQRLHEALMALDEPYRATLMQRFFEDRTPAAIAAASGTPLATVKSRLQRGVALLRERLDRQRSDWRAALCSALALDRTPAAPTAPLATLTAGLLVSTATKFAAAVGVVAVAAWLAVGSPAAPPAEPVDAGGTGGGAASVAALGDAATGAAAAGRHRVEAGPAAPPPTAAAPILLRAVDAAQGAPLPQFAVAVEVPDRPGSERLVTDDEGRLTLPPEWRGVDTVSLRALDDASNPIALHQVQTVHRYDWPPAGAVRDVAFAVGPTYELVFDAPPPEDAELLAVLTAGAAPELRRPGSSHVRRGPLPWVRLDAYDANASALGIGPWTLTVRDVDGTWWAAGPVHAVRGRQGDPVHLRARASGVLQVVLDGIDAATAERRDAHLSVYRLGDDGEPLPRDITVSFGRALLARVECLEPGRYRAWIGLRDGAPQRHDVEIRAAATTEVRATVAAPDVDTATLTVLLRSTTGAHAIQSVVLTARRPDGTDRRFPRFEPTWSTLPTAQTGGHARGTSSTRYVFDDLPAGEWIVELDPPPQLPPFDRTEQRVRADAGSIEFVCRDDGVPPPVRRRVEVTLLDGTPAAFAGITTFVGGRQILSGTVATDGSYEIGPFLEGQAVQVLVRAAGCLPVWSTTTLAAATAREPLRVALRPGWGTLLHVQEAHGITGRPLPGVEVLADGVPIGTTDQFGDLLLQGAAPPRHLELHRDGYEVSYLSADDSGMLEPQEQMPHYAMLRRRR